jgi:hypothetical protein
MPIVDYECEPASFREFVTECSDRALHYGDYVFSGIVIIVAIIMSIILLTAILLFLYIVPAAIGNWFLHNRKVSERYKKDYNSSFPWNWSWNYDGKRIVTGYLVIFIFLSAIISIIVALYWLGHLVL